MPIKRVTYTDSKQSLNDMFLKHNQEIATLTMPDVKVDIDDETYTYLEKNNKYLGYIISNNEGIDIGYLGIFIYNHHHHKYVRCALTDAFYIDCKYRSFKSFRWISEAFVEAEKILKTEFGVKYFYLSSSARKDLKTLAYSLGFDPCDIVYSKYIGG